METLPSSAGRQPEVTLKDFTGGRIRKQVQGQIRMRSLIFTQVVGEDGRPEKMPAPGEGHGEGRDRGGGGDGGGGEGEGEGEGRGGGMVKEQDGGGGGVGGGDWRGRGRGRGGGARGGARAAVLRAAVCPALDGGGL